jgi:moderate conductance mechanosensitive channel
LSNPKFHRLSRLRIRAWEQIERVSQRLYSLHAHWRNRFLSRFLLCSLTTLLLAIGSGTYANSVSIPSNPSVSHPVAQLPSLTMPTSTPTLPAGVERRGNLEIVGVRLDGKELFKVASPAVFKRGEPGSLIPVETRAAQIEANLAQLFRGSGTLEESQLEPETLQVSVETLRGQPILLVKDTNMAVAKVLLTVTDTDAQYYSASKDAVANRWQEILDQELRQALILRKPEALKSQIATVLKTLAVTVILTLLLVGIWRILEWRRRRLERQQLEEERLEQQHPERQRQEQQRQEQQRQEQQPVITNTVPRQVLDQEPDQVVLSDRELPSSEQQLFQQLRQYFGFQQRLQIIWFLRWLVFWAIAFVWGIGIAYGLSVFPQTRQFSRQVLTIPLVLLMTWFLIGLVNRLTDLAIDRFVEHREQEQSLVLNLQRITTIIRVLKQLKMVVLYTVGVLSALQWLNLVPTTVFTLGALLALAVSFAAQSLVKDLVNGFLILMEDQFRIGDAVRVGTISGNVENLNLRITQIRTDDGGLVTIPNSLITQIENLSRNWARMNLRIEVAYNTDVNKALAVIQETIDHLAQEPGWETLILNTHEKLGVEQLSHTGIAIRVWVKTVPFQEGEIKRELQRRLKIAFDRAHIQIGIPQQVLQTDSSFSESELNQSETISK